MTEAIQDDNQQKFLAIMNMGLYKKKVSSEEMQLISRVAKEIWYPQ
jgi:hypothetical protein